MNSNTLSAPPPAPTAESLTGAFTLLAVAADPKGCKARLEQLIKATEECRTAHAEMEAERKRLDNRLQSVDDLRKRENAVAAESEKLRQTAEQQAATKHAHNQRETQFYGREADLAARVKKHEDAVAAHNRRVAQAAAALAG